MLSLEKSYLKGLARKDHKGEKRTPEVLAERRGTPGGMGPSSRWRKGGSARKEGEDTASPGKSSSPSKDRARTAGRKGESAFLCLEEEKPEKRQPLPKKTIHCRQVLGGHLGEGERSLQQQKRILRGEGGKFHSRIL